MNLFKVISALYFIYFIFLWNKNYPIFTRWGHFLLFLRDFVKEKTLVYDFKSKITYRVLAYIYVCWCSLVDVIDTTDALIQTGTYIFLYIEYMQAIKKTLTVTSTLIFTYDSLKCLVHWCQVHIKWLLSNRSQIILPQGSKIVQSSKKIKVSLFSMLFGWYTNSSLANL